MGALLLIGLLVAAVIGFYVYVHGAPGHNGVSVPWSSVDPQAIPSDVMQAIHDNPHIVVLAAVSGGVAWLIRIGWNKIGNWGRFPLLVGLGIFLAYAVGHR